MSSTLAKLKEYMLSKSDRLFNTPDRTLDRAYQAAQRIVVLEEQHFNGGKVPTEFASDGSQGETFLKAELEQNIGIVKLKLAEFQASGLIFESLSDSQIEKLSFIDQVLDRYDTSSSAIVPISQPGIIKPAKANQPPPPISSADKSGVVLPRSIGNTLKRLKEDLSPQSEEEVLQKFRDARNKTIISVRFILTLMIVPLLTQVIFKQFIVSPIVEQVNSGEKVTVFLNHEMKEEAFKQLASFEENLKFNVLIHATPPLSEEETEEKVIQEVGKIAEEFHAKSKNAISNVFADIIAVAALMITLLMSQNEIAVLKSFMDDLVYGLSDSAKAFIIILVTDIFVGFHSPHGWDVLLEGVANHLGVAPNASMISLFIATVPVIMDTALKYWTFRYLTRMSPSTVATLKEMNE